MDIKTVYSKLVFLANGFIETNVFYGMSKEDKTNFYNIAGEAVEKQMPKKPIKEEEKYKKITVEIYYCPSCNSEITRRSKSSWLYETPHCSECGQKIDWSEVENE